MTQLWLMRRKEKSAAVGLGSGLSFWVKSLSPGRQSQKEICSFLVLFGLDVIFDSCLWMEFSSFLPMDGVKAQKILGLADLIRPLHQHALEPILLLRFLCWNYTKLMLILS